MSRFRALFHDEYGPRTWFLIAQIALYSALVVVSALDLIAGKS